MSTPTGRSAEHAVPQAVPAVVRATVPSGWRARATVWEYLVLTWRPYFLSGLASAVIAPLLYLLALGFGMGSLIEARGTGALGGVRYVEFIGPALLCAAALQTSFGESSWALFGRFKWHRTLWGITSTPITPAQAAEGHVLFIATRVAVSSVLYYLVLLAFGAAGGGAGVLMLPVAVLTALSCAVWVMALSATIDDDGPAAFNLALRFGIIPMTLFSASFFPITQLPWAVRWVAFLSPLWHGNELARGAAIGGLPGWQAAGHLAFLVALSITGFVVMRRRFDVRLVV
ncbi:ABC transporter permease [Nakamurella sp. A5-74]|uniref:Transport permease protein n=1 Tax=Nakamurella sp. A5-74 TaxID=3158264 RepID=A0AAU8DS25_9ACTN